MVFADAGLVEYSGECVALGLFFAFALLLCLFSESIRFVCAIGILRVVLGMGIVSAIMITEMIMVVV